MFSLEQALAQTTRILAERAKNKTNSYVCYFSNDTKRYEGKFEAITIKQAIGEFRRSHAQYRYAFITKKNNDTVLRAYVADAGKKFYSLTRKAKTK